MIRRPPLYVSPCVRRGDNYLDTGGSTVHVHSPPCSNCIFLLFVRHDNYPDTAGAVTFNNLFLIQRC